MSARALLGTTSISNRGSSPHPDPPPLAGGGVGRGGGHAVRRIGIDVGGTNTDAVLLQDGRVVHAVKTPTTEDVTGGIVAALALLTRHPRSEERRVGKECR